MIKKKFKIKSLTLLTLTYLYLLTTNVVLATDNSATSITVVTEIAPPLQYLEKGKLAGETTKKVSAILKSAGIDANFQVYPWARAYDYALRHKNTLIYPIIRSPERESKFEWIGQLLTLNLSIIQIKNTSAKPLKNLNQAKTLKIGLMRNDYVHQLLMKYDFIEGQHFKLASNLTQLLSLLYSGKIDAMLASLPLLKTMASSQGFEPQRLISVFELENQNLPLYLAASKTTEPTLIKRLKKQFN